MKTYSQDLRDKMLAALDRGMPRKEAVGAFGVSPATLKRWLRRRRQTGSVVPKSRRLGMRLRIGASALPNAAPPVAPAREEHPEATLEEHRELWEHERGVRVSVATMSRAIRRLGWTYKQRRREPPSATRKHGPTGASG
jgi:transposase